MSTPAQETVSPRASSPRSKPHITDQPITLKNWYQHVNWLNVYFIGVLPLIGCVAAFWTTLKWQTAVWAVVYYYCTGLGMFAPVVFRDNIS
jgi:stearoyl-CoA desaturase (delta-9 desaturase)